jgi:class 3 adenylate cyclase
VLFGNDPAPLELLFGTENYSDQLRYAAIRGLLTMVIGGLLALALPGAPIAHFRTGILAGVFLAALIVATVISLAQVQWPVWRWSWVVLVFLPLVGLGIWAAGPSVAESAVSIPTIGAAVFVWFPRRAAAILTATMVAIFAGVVTVEPGHPRPLMRVLFVSAFTAGATWTVEWFVRHLGALAASERALHEEVGAARTQLEARVTEQVEEIERLGKLRRFLSPQIADTVLSRGGDDVLATHRRQIAVIFLDLRGFTAFSAVAEPEDVVEVLSEFYAAVGEVVKRLDATVGGFAGDGVMAYFNDPVPCEDPAGRALDMALSLRDPMALLKDRWRDRGFDIGYGAGIAYGYATLGTIGFEARTDYTPIGSVVNLASRLCDEAGDGEVLLDGRAHNAVRNRVDTSPVELTLKGFGAPVTAHRISVT